MNSYEKGADEAIQQESDRCILSEVSVDDVSEREIMERDIEFIKAMIHRILSRY